MTFLLVTLGLLVNAQASVYEADFSGEKFDADRLQATSAKDVPLLQRKADGLKIALRPESDKDATGVKTRFGLKGDFSITLTYRIDKLDVPADGYGVGPGIYITTSSDRKHAATLSRVARHKEGQVHVAHVAADAANSKRRNQNVNFFPSEWTAGKLRLSRVGERLDFAACEEGKDEFTTLTTLPFTDADVTQIRLAVQRNQAAKPVAEVVLKSARIEAGEFFTPSRGGASRSLLPIGMAAAALLVAAGCVWAWRRAR